jgi:diadenosine tetraphosphatase ApaH/serine/threonine PP2A family protein phosphatase
VIAENNLEFLRGLPEVREEDRFYCVHGSLVSPLDEYVTGVAEAIQTFNLMSKPLCFIGHSHRPLFIACRTDGNYDGKILKDKDEILTSDYKKVIINVGGVGQPRDGDPRASFGVYDTSTDLFSLQRVTYDFEKTQQKMIQAGLPQFLIDRLQFGK